MSSETGHILILKLTGYPFTLYSELVAYKISYKF